MRVSIAIFLVFQFILDLTEYCVSQRAGLGQRSVQRQRGLASCPIPKVENGGVRMRSRGRNARITCASGFTIEGARNMLCLGGRWEDETPICTKAGCAEPPFAVAHGHTLFMDSRRKVIICDHGYLVSGSAMAFCNGTDWDRSLGTCEPTAGDSMSCDFETNNLCGWESEMMTEFEWKRRSGWVSFERLDYGPKHDHTIGKPLDGHYLVAEATGYRQNDVARLMSPIYMLNTTYACFRFYYHMYGTDVGRLRVYIRFFNETMQITTTNPKRLLFEVSRNQGNRWNEAILHIDGVDREFQMVFEATGSRTLSDIAIDDVSLYNDAMCRHALATEEITEATTELGGIYQMQSCTDRCNETQSMRGPGNNTIVMNNRIVEVCDCHADCVDSETCCYDYKYVCILDDPVSPTVMPEVQQTTIVQPLEATTKQNETSESAPSASNSNEMSNNGTAATTIATPSKEMTAIPTTSTSTTATTTRTTKSTPTQMAPNTTTAPPTTIKITKITQIAPKTTTPTKATSIIAKIPKTVFINTNVSNSFDAPRAINRTITSTTKKNPTTMTTAKSRTKVAVAKTTLAKTTPSPATKPTTTQNTNRTIARINASMSKDTNVTGVSDSPAYSPKRPMLIVPILAVVIAISGILVVLLMVWRHISHNKWKRCHTTIEYRTKNYAKQCTNGTAVSFDDSMNLTLIDNGSICCGTDDDNDDERKEQPPQQMDKVKIEASRKAQSNANGGDAKQAAEPAPAPRKMKKMLSKSAKRMDEYSEKRCLTADEEQFDFSLQVDM